MLRFGKSKSDLALGKCNLLLSVTMLGSPRPARPLNFVRGTKAGQPSEPSQAAGQNGSLAARQPGSQAARQPGRQAARQPGSPTKKYIYIYIYIYIYYRQPSSQAGMQPSGWPDSEGPPDGERSGPARQPSSQAGMQPSASGSPPSPPG